MKFQKILERIWNFAEKHPVEAVALPALSLAAVGGGVGVGMHQSTKTNTPKGREKPVDDQTSECKLGDFIYEGVDDALTFTATFTSPGRFFDDVYNVLVLGVTGMGKSRLINILFNRCVSRISVSVDSTEQNMLFHVGKGKIDGKERNIQIIDSVGISDTRLGNKEAVTRIKGGMSGMRFDKVLIVHGGGARVGLHHKHDFQEILKELNYDELDPDAASSVKFIYTKADDKNDFHRNKLKAQELVQALTDRDDADSLAVSFPRDKRFKDVKEDRAKLMKLVFKTKTKPITADAK